MSDRAYVEILAAYFREHPSEWLDGLTLAGLAGAYAWRSRVSDVRARYGYTIENRQRKVGKRTVSEYCYRPAVVPVQAGLFEGQGAA